MPLVRYEVRCERCLANPELYRATSGAAEAAGSVDDDTAAAAAAAADDDVSSPGLSEGVVVAHLVGIVRQLGNLVEFAGEIFCELHEKLTTLRQRGSGLKARLLKLETELPAIEKDLRSSTDQFLYNYIAGAQWHPSLWTNQNNLTKSDLPNFVRNFYENCRGPPRLFLLDKFDVAGEGACMKRYTNPSFYTTLNLSLEFKKVHNQCWSNKVEKKDRWCKTGPETQGSFLCFSHRKQSSFIYTKNLNDAFGATSPQMQIMEQETSSVDVQFAKGLSPISPGEMKTQVDDETFLEVERESGSDGEHFVDALATMYSELDTDDSETEVLPEPYEDVVPPLVSNSVVVSTESPPQEKSSLEQVLGLLHRNLSKDRTSLKEKEVLQAVSSKLEGLMKQHEEDLGFQEEQNLWFTPINLLEADDDLGYEKYSPCHLADLAPSILNQFQCQTHTESQREKTPEVISLQEKLLESTDFQERSQAGFGGKFHSSYVVSLPQVPESIRSEDLSATQKVDPGVEDRKSSLVVNEMDQQHLDKEDKCVLNDDIAMMDMTTSITDNCSECRRSADKTDNPLTSASSSDMSYSVSESASQAEEEEREHMNLSLLHSPLMSPWSKLLSSTNLFPDSSGSDDSFRIHSVQSPPIVPIVDTSSPTTTHSTEQKHSEGAWVVRDADAVLT